MSTQAEACRKLLESLQEIVKAYKDLAKLFPVK